jgi:hypothetical protein
MNGRATRATKTWLTEWSDSVTMGAAGANKGFADDLQNLHSLMDSIAADDGVRPHASRIRYQILVTSPSPFWAQLIALQTNGNITDVVDIVPSTLDDLIEPMTDDVFGYQKLTESKLSIKSPTLAAGTVHAVNNFCCRLVGNLPGNLLQLLNKETETERLQTLSLALVGKAYTNDQVISFWGCLEVEFVQIAKKIVLR